MGLFSKKTEPISSTLNQEVKKIEIKGIEMSSFYEGEKQLDISLGGINGILYIETYDNLVSTLHWRTPSISYSQVSQLIKGLESKFGITLSLEDIDDIDKPSHSYYGKTDRYRFVVLIEQTEDYTDNFGLIIVDEILYEKKNKIDTSDF